MSAILHLTVGRPRKRTMRFDLGPLTNPKTGKPYYTRPFGQHCGYDECDICRREAVSIATVVPHHLPAQEANE